MVESFAFSLNLRKSRISIHHFHVDAAKTPADKYPSTAELITKFDLRFRWVVSIGFALRSDVVYPSNILEFGSCEAEQKFNWVVSKYAKVTEFMSKFTLIENLYGLGTTWYTCKNLAFRAPRVSGPNWMAIGDATVLRIHYTLQESRRTWQQASSLPNVSRTILHKMRLERPKS